MLHNFLILFVFLPVSKALRGSFLILCRACPFALDAITNVLFLGVPLQEVLSLLNMPQSSAAGAIPEW